ncbi:MAG TPA: hypothetical protein VGZ22_17285 [Isosphaeraceae bacterium]|nr:hypothetical protein [Isosphaeraceae bacterium]
MLRRPAFPAAFAVVALFLAARPTPALAAGIIPQAATGTSSYELLNTNPAGTAPVTKIVTSVIPPGTVVPPNPSTSPLTILPGSSGFDQNNLQVLLGQGQTPSGAPLQALALNFGTQGFAPGGVLNFSLSLDKAFQGSPTLQLPDGTTGLTIKQLANEQSGGGSTGNGNGGSISTPSTGHSTGNQVPEPLTLALWATGVVGLGLARARAYRRSCSPTV